MSGIEGEREKLKTLLNAGLELRKKLFASKEQSEESKALCGELLRISGAARTLAVQIKHPHGQACSMELQLAGRIWVMTCLLLLTGVFVVLEVILKWVFSFL